MAAEIDTDALNMEWGETDRLLETREVVEVGRRTIFRTGSIITGLFVFCAAVGLWHGQVDYSKANMRKGFLTGLAEDEDVETVTDDLCDNLPYVRLDKVISSNLGKKGPDNDAEEGIIFQAHAHAVGKNYSNLQIHIHSLKNFTETDTEEAKAYDENYEPAFTHGEYVNGLHGRFATISVKPNKSVKVRVHAYDADEKKDIPVPHGAISFFDLDTGINDTHSVERITMRNTYSDYYLSNETEIKVSKADGLTTFSATKEGTGDDNPSDPLSLTRLQKNRAVTLDYEDFTEFNFEIGVSEGQRNRVFSFCFRPSLLCAKTKVGAKDFPARGKDAPVVPVRSATYEKSQPLIVVLSVLAAFV